MKLKSILTAGMLMSALAASDASADNYCSLDVNPWSYILRGQSFSYGIDIGYQVLPGPWPPGWPPSSFTVVFHGTNIPESGEGYPGVFYYGHSDLTGYQNPPSGGYSGTYIRYAEVYANGFPNFPYCVTNMVAVVLE